MVRRAAPWASETGPMTTRLPIGDFSRMTYLSVKALRRYHDMGLLEPADVDPATGYRYYDASQVPIGQVIRRFRDLGMPLEQLKGVLHAPDAVSRNELIVGHLRSMEAELAHTQQTVASLRAILEGPSAPITVEYRTVAATSALAISEPVAMADIETWWAEAFDELHQALRSMYARRSGPDGALYPSEFFEDELGAVMAFVPVAAEPGLAGPESAGPESAGTESAGPESAGRIRRVEIPGAELAVTVHAGSFAELDQAYGALGTFVAEREIGVVGPIREHYVVSNEQTDDESRHRTEVCWPVFHIKGGAT